jgi:hypothetical protein
MLKIKGEIIFRTFLRIKFSLKDGPSVNGENTLMLGYY